MVQSLDIHMVVVFVSCRLARTQQHFGTHWQAQCRIRKYRIQHHTLPPTPHATPSVGCRNRFAIKRPTDVYQRQLTIFRCTCVRCIPSLGLLLSMLVFKCVVGYGGYVGNTIIIPSREIYFSTFVFMLRRRRIFEEGLRRVACTWVYDRVLTGVVGRMKTFL